MRLIDVDEFLADESEAYMIAQIALAEQNADKTIDANRYINQLVHKKIQMLIADAPTIEPERGEWIPCSERLPSSSGKCLVTEGVEQKTTLIGFFSTEHKRFYSAMDVIAWMPLPEPYCGADMREREDE